MTIPEARDGVELRPFDPSDAAAVNAVAAAAWQQYAAVFDDWPPLAAFVASTASLSAECDLIVATDRDRVVGVVGYTGPGRPRESIFPLHWGIVRMLSVAPDARGRGIGRRLVDACIARARADRAAVLGLHTSPVMREALALYLRLGFVLDREIPPRRGVPYSLYALPIA
jgi:ribosomal protein S18 acetylase RimI-like enzyme